MTAVVVDVGGSGARVAHAERGRVVDVTRADVESVDDLIDAVRSCDSSPAAIGISVPGLVNRDTGELLQCAVRPDLVGDLRGSLSSVFGCPVAVLNDGSAHAVAATREPNIRYGAICISIGTGVGFGVLDNTGALQSTLTGMSWEIGDLSIKTSASCEQVWWALGSPGLNELISQRGEADGLRRYGYRLGAFARSMVITFQAPTVCFSGGHVARYWSYFEDGVRRELGHSLARNVQPIAVPLRSGEPALLGLAITVADY